MIPCDLQWMKKLREIAYQQSKFEQNKKLHSFYVPILCTRIFVGTSNTPIQRTALDRKITATMLLNFKLHKISSALNASFGKNKRLEWEIHISNATAMSMWYIRRERCEQEKAREVSKCKSFSPILFLFSAGFV